MLKSIIEFIKDLYGCPQELIPLHAPVFEGNEKKYVDNCIDSTYVSSIGEFVDLFEAKIAHFTGAKYAIATVNGTAALHTALMLAGVLPGDQVITQAVSFVATANAISYCNAKPVFLDSDPVTLGLSPQALESFLEENTEIRDDGFCYTIKNGCRIMSCVPMHVFGHPVKIDEIESTCAKYNIALVEDAAEALGSYYNGVHLGRFGKMGVLSFNGNKILTTGGGGIIITDDPVFAAQARHITTTAKVQHPWAFTHDQIGFNYRMPNLNAALGCAQLEQLPSFLKAKRQLACNYAEFFQDTDISFFKEPMRACSNYWLNALFFEDHGQRDDFLEYSNRNGVMTRPLWTLLPKLIMYKDCLTDSMKNARWIEKRLVNIPSSVIR